MLLKKLKIKLYIMIKEFLNYKYNIYIYIYNHDKIIKLDIMILNFFFVLYNIYFIVYIILNKLFVKITDIN